MTGDNVQLYYRTAARTTASHTISPSHELLVHSCILQARVINTLLRECGTRGAAAPLAQKQGFDEQNILPFVLERVFVAWQTSALDVTQESCF